MIDLLIILVALFGVPSFHNSLSENQTRVCLIDEDKDLLTIDNSMDGSNQTSPYVQLINNHNEILLAENTFKLPLALAMSDKSCFDQPFYLYHDEKGYQWINTNGEILYDVYWFDNGPDYASDGLFRFKQNGLIGYADAKTFAIVIPAQFEVALPFEQGKAKVAYEVYPSTNDHSHQALQSPEFILIDKQGHRLDK